MLLAVLLLAGCAGSVSESDITGKTYLYEKDGFGGDFAITIEEDGTFRYYEGPLSSHIGYGEWTLEEDTLLLTENNLTNYFKVDGSDLIFLEENSSNFTYVTVSGGERFSGSPAEPSGA